MAIDAELTALGHVVDAIKRERADPAAAARHVKRAFVALQRVLVGCRAFVAGDRAEVSARARRRRRRAAGGVRADAPNPAGPPP